MKFTKFEIQKELMRREAENKPDIKKITTLDLERMLDQLKKQEESKP